MPLALILPRGDQWYLLRKPLIRRDNGDTLSLLEQLLLEPWVPCAPPPAFLLLSRLSGLAASEPTLSFLFFFSFHPCLPRFPHSVYNYFAVSCAFSPCVCVCVCVFIKFHITAQSGPVILVILCHSHWSSRGRSMIDDRLYCVCVYIYIIKLHIVIVKVAVNTVWILSKSCMCFGCSGSQKTLISCLGAGFVFLYEDIPGAIRFSPLPYTIVKQQEGLGAFWFFFKHSTGGCSEALGAFWFLFKQHSDLGACCTLFKKNMNASKPCVVVFFTLTDRASTIPSNIRGCQSDTWSQRGTKVNGSHHGDNPLLRPTGIQIATKSYATLQAMAPANNETVHQTSFTIRRYFQHAHFIPIVGVGKRGEY